MRTMNVEWHEFSNEKPPDNGTYIVRLHQDEALSLGFGSSIPVLTAHYNKHEKKWKNFGLVPMELNVIAWHERSYA